MSQTLNPLQQGVPPSPANALADAIRNPPPAQAPPAKPDLTALSSNPTIVRRRPVALPGVIDRPDDRVSTYIPTGKGSEALDPHGRNDLQINTQVMKSEPKTFAKNMTKIRENHTYLGDMGHMNDDEVAERFTQHLHDNIVAMWNKLPASWRERSTRWYEGANILAKQLADEHGISHRQAAAVLANLSPQKDWYQNYDLGRRLLGIHRDQQDFQVTDEMRARMQKYVDQRKDNTPAAALNKQKLQDAVDFVGNKKLSDLEDPLHKALFVRAYDEIYNKDRSYHALSPEGAVLGKQLTEVSKRPQNVAWGDLTSIQRAMQALGEDSRRNISESLGGMHKVRSFYNNIINPNSEFGDLTADTHAINVGHLLPMGGSHPMVASGMGNGKWSSSSEVSGAQGLYGLYADAYRRAADTLSTKRRRYLPREIQSPTWDAIRTVYNNNVMKKSDDKTGEFLHETGIKSWKAWHELPSDKARVAALNAAGAIDKKGQLLRIPDWV